MNTLMSSYRETTLCNSEFLNVHTRLIAVYLLMLLKWNLASIPTGLWSLKRQPHKATHGLSALRKLSLGCTPLKPLLSWGPFLRITLVWVCLVVHCQGNKGSQKARRRSGINRILEKRTWIDSHFISLGQLQPFRIVNGCFMTVMIFMSLYCCFPWQDHSGPMRISSV